MTIPTSSRSFRGLPPSAFRASSDVFGYGRVFESPGTFTRLRQKISWQVHKRDLFKDDQCISDLFSFPYKMFLPRTFIKVFPKIVNCLSQLAVGVMMSV